MNLRTANKHRKQTARRAIVKAAFEFHLSQCKRGRLKANSGYIRRRRKELRTMRHKAAK